MLTSWSMSLRTRLVVYFTVLFAGALILLGCGTYFAVREALMRGARQDVQTGTNQMLTFYQVGGQGNLSTIVDKDGQVRPLARGEFTQFFNNPDLIVQVFSPRGRLIGRAPNLDEREVPLPSAALDLGPGEGVEVFQEIDGARVMTRVTPLVATVIRSNLDVDQEVAGYLQVSRPLSDVDLTMRILVFILVSSSSLGMVFCILGVSYLSRRALRPITRLTQTAQSIVRAEDLAQRVPVPTSQDEMARLTVTINDLLARLETLFVTQRRFVADVSHELRTPLTAMQGNLEILARSGCTHPEIFNEALGDMRRETARLIRMVNDLLLLAQSDSGIPLRSDKVELDTLLLEVYRELRPLTNGVILRIGAEDQIEVPGDRDRIKQALLNIGMNALQHTPAGGSVILGLERHDGFACLSVADTGSGIAPQDLPLIFERFYRADHARSRHNGGAGLGLSIVKRIAEAHGGHATVASELGRGSTFAIWLPLQAPVPQLAAPVTQSVM